MNRQKQIKRTLSKPEAVEYVRRLVEEEESFSRTELAEFVCEQFGFQDPRGQNQLSGCLKGLRNLERADDPGASAGSGAVGRTAGPLSNRLRPRLAGGVRFCRASAATSGPGSLDWLGC